MELDRTCSQARPQFLGRLRQRCKMHGVDQKGQADEGREGRMTRRNEQGTKAPEQRGTGMTGKIYIWY